MELTAKLALSDVVKSPNVAELLGEADLRIIGQRAKEEYDLDLTARTEWDKAYAEAMKLALQIVEEKTFPWPNCANVKFPLLTVAAINFHAKAYPSLINGEEVVSYKVVGKDEAGTNALRSKRVSAHMNYQLLEASDWEANEDKAMLVTPIMGCSFKKRYFDPDETTVVSRLILPQHLVVPYFTTDLKTCPRISEVFKLDKNGFTSRIRRGIWLDQPYYENYDEAQTDMEVAKQDGQKITPVAYPDGAPTEFIEQHRFLDLDGDGYEEPYIVTFVSDTGQVCRIVARFFTESIRKGEGRFKEQIAYIEPRHFYTKKPFIPSPDGGFYDLGLGMLLGPLNHAADTLINQMIDAGTMELLGGGFLGRGVKIRKGDNTFKPYEWKTVDSPGASLKDNVVPLPHNQPSTVLLELLQFLIQWGERIGSANEVQMGELPGQNVKTGSMQIANANGQKVFAAIFKRWWRQTKEEFCGIYQLNAIYINAAQAVVLRMGPEVDAQDYAMPMMGIRPVADPNVSSREELQRRADMVLKACLTIPGQDVREATMRMYDAYNVPQPELLWPTGDKAIAPQPDVKMLAVQVKQLEAETHRLQATNAIRLAQATLIKDVQESQAKIINLQAQAAKAMAEAQGVGAGHAIALIDAEIAMNKNHIDSGLKIVELMQGALDGASKGTTASPADAGGTGMDKLAKVANDPAILSLSGGQAAGNDGTMGAGAVQSGNPGDISPT